ncbi:MAG: c-type cytochrome [Bryobacteraceae bacterium]
MKISVMVLLLSVAALAQGPGRQMPAPKNLKILKPENLMPAMRAFRTALGVKCEFCHVEGDFASDENPHKEIARKMMLMTHEINAKFPDGKMHVTCYTCHRGAEEPATRPAGEAGGEHEHGEHAHEDHSH